MRMSKEAREKINETFNERALGDPELRRHNINLREVFGETDIAAGSWCISKLEDLSALIYELTIMKETIRNTTGVDF